MQPRRPRADERIAHPTRRAAMLMIVVGLVVLGLAIVSTLRV